MKKLMLIFYFFITVISFSSSQKDQQWLILNGLGKTGWTGMGNDSFNIYAPSNNINYDFTLSGVRHPNRPQDPRRKNDIFVIYADGNYMNTRDISDPFFPSGQNYQDPNDRAHNFRNTHTSPIQYLYLTNIYEDDDPPKYVTAMNGHNVRLQQPYPLDITHLGSDLQANHDVVKNTDITLIIPSNIIVTGDKLYINTTQLISGGGVTVDTFFKVSRIFNNWTDFSNTPAIDNGNGTITLQGVNPYQVPYIFINLRPTRILPRYYATNSSLNSKAIFTIIRQKDGSPDQRIAFLDEDIVASHDPNFVQLQSLCQRNSENFAFYHVEFQNDGVRAANHLSVALILPPWLDPTCINDPKFVAGDKTVEGSFKVKSVKIPATTVFGTPSPTLGSKRQNMIVFKFNKNASVQPYSKYSPELSTGFVEFCIKVRDMRPELENESRYKLIDPKVYFGNDYTDIHEFFGPKTPVNSYSNDIPALPAMVRECKCRCKMLGAKN